MKQPEWPRLFPKSRPNKAPVFDSALSTWRKENGYWGEMQDESLYFWTQSHQSERCAGYQQILGGLCFVLLCTVHLRLPGETVWQELSLWKMHQRILYLWPRMGWRSVPALPREVQVSGLAPKVALLNHLWPALCYYIHNWLLATQKMFGSLFDPAVCHQTTVWAD